MLRFEKKWKLSPHYMGPYEIVERIGEVAYRLRLPTELARIHDVFHVSMLRKYIVDPSHVLRDQPVELKEDLTYEERLVHIVDRKDQFLQNKIIPLVKVLWMNHGREEATWERDVFHVSMLRKYMENPSHVLRDQPVELKEDLTYEKRPV